MQWDNFIEEVSVLEQSDTGRMQVVQTKYKTISNLDGREFIEKKLYFCHSEVTSDEQDPCTPTSSIVASAQKKSRYRSSSPRNERQRKQLQRKKSMHANK